MQNISMQEEGQKKKRKPIPPEKQAEYNRRYNESDKGREYRRNYYLEHLDEIRRINRENYQKKKQNTKKIQELYSEFGIILKGEKAMVS